ncbi:hypothetical protein B296_00028276, partial [Ensete ventricosum]
HVKPTTRTCSCFFLFPSHCGFSLLLPIITAEQSLLCYTIDSLPVLISRVELLCPLLSTFPERVSCVVAVAQQTGITSAHAAQAAIAAAGRESGSLKVRHYYQSYATCSEHNCSHIHFIAFVDFDIETLTTARSSGSLITS